MLQRRRVERRRLRVASRDAVTSAFPISLIVPTVCGSLIVRRGIRPSDGDGAKSRSRSGLEVRAKREQGIAATSGAQ